jgi:hypothetical protein
MLLLLLLVARCPLKSRKQRLAAMSMLLLTGLTRCSSRHQTQ